tara:strand:- start:3159 stop:4352 length:1194 start_codon:yes stop_codon:yes gene_type:complete
MELLSMKDLDLNNKIVIIREDLNVPIKNGKVTNTNRIDSALITIKLALSKGAKVAIISHLGRPKEGEYNPEYSLAPIADILKEKLNIPVQFVQNWLEGFDINAGELFLLENIRFCVGEKSNADELSKKIASLADVYVMDAFATAHRQHASTYGALKYAKQDGKEVCAGPLFLAEINALQKGLANPKKPIVAIVGGSKISTKIDILTKLITKVDQLIVGGGIANTFIAASGLNIGNSLYEESYLGTARKLLKDAQDKGSIIPMPVDVVVAKEISDDAKTCIKSVNNVENGDLILDIGPDTAKMLCKYISKANTIIWNGPLGVFEHASFAEGTKKIANAIANSSAYSLAGGGDTIAAIDKFNIADKISYISTGGGAFLDFIQSDTFAVLELLAKKDKNF